MSVASPSYSVIHLAAVVYAHGDLVEERVLRAEVEAPGDLAGALKAHLGHVFPACEDRRLGDARYLDGGIHRLQAQTDLQVFHLISHDRIDVERLNFRLQRSGTTCVRLVPVRPQPERIKDSETDRKVFHRHDEVEMGRVVERVLLFGLVTDAREGIVTGKRSRRRDERRTERYGPLLPYDARRVVDDG